MPKVTIWIRVADEAKWKAIEKKPEWLHAVLNDDWIMEAIKYIDKGEDGKPVFVMQQDKFMELSKTPKPVSQTIQDTTQAVVESLRESEVIKAEIKLIQQKLDTPNLTSSILDNPDLYGVVLCDHYQPKGQCNVKNCKFGRGIK